MSSQLVVSLSGLDLGTTPHVLDLAAELAPRRVALSLLVAPRPDPSGDALDWVRGRRAGGDAVVMHGYGLTHGNGSGIGRPARLPSHEAGLALVAAERRFETFGLAADGFVPPRWVASPGALVALRQRDFRLCADLLGVRLLDSGQTLPGRVLGVGRRHATEPWWCAALVLGAARTARRGGLVRVAIDAADLARPGPRRAVLDAVDIALHHGATPVTYAGLGRDVPGRDTPGRTCRTPATVRV